MIRIEPHTQSCPAGQRRSRRLLAAMFRMPACLHAICLCLCLCVAGNTCAQELDCNVSINAEQLETAYRDRFATLQQDLAELINNQAWTSAQFTNVEKISCTFALTILTMPSADTYTATLTVQSRRPVYYSSYNTSMLNWKDEEITFTYTEGQMLNYNEFNLDNELVAIAAYYVNLILGTDFDSFSPKGGESYLRRAENIVTQMQNSENPGWKAFDKPRNRHALITALLSESEGGVYRALWYDYHRQGLDVMFQNMDKGRAQVTAACMRLEEVRSANAQTPLLAMFVAAKLDEWLDIYSEAPMTEKQEVFKALQEVYPSYTNRLSEIKKEYKE